MLVLKLLLVYLSSVLSICTAQDAATDDAVKKKPSFNTPNIPSGAYLALFFNSPSDLSQKLVVSQARKDGIDDSIAKYDGIWSVEVPRSSAIDGDYALVLKSKAKHHAVSTKLSRPLKFDSGELVIQYDVKFQDGIDCGGAYIKLLSSSANLDLKQFNDKTPYTIMFGPDKCGLDNKFHFIFRYKNPNTGVFEEKHAKRVLPELDSYFSDKKTHLYTLVLRSDNTFERYIDQVKVQSGNLLDDFEDPEMDGEWIAPKISNPKCANAPGCGEWQRPVIPNPKYKGKWSAPMIPNPAYKGIWTPRKIPNPNYFEEKNPYKGLMEVSAVGLELWSMTDEIAFDNFLIVDSKRAADDFAKETWADKKEAERLSDPRAQSVVDAIRETYNEKPWLIFVIGLVCTLPILLCCIYFCRSPSKYDVGVHKKTDLPIPDDFHQKDDEKDAEIEELEESGEDDIVQVSKGSGDESDANKTGSSSKGDLDADSAEEATDGATETKGASTEKQSVRKRRSRKE
ncbi:unnamed protein product [Heterobilharzia americana]|nr:unnamed protein product [Heterobilharzia americana]